MALPPTCPFFPNKVSKGGDLFSLRLLFALQTVAQHYQSPSFCCLHFTVHKQQFIVHSNVYSSFKWQSETMSLVEHALFFVVVDADPCQCHSTRISSPSPPPIRSFATNIDIVALRTRSGGRTTRTSQKQPPSLFFKKFHSAFFFGGTHTHRTHADPRRGLSR